MFLFAGLCFKVSAVPFHMWTPDVYEGAPTPVTAFFAAAPKVAAMAMFVRVAIGAFPGIVPQWQQIMVFVAIASMALGAFAAIGQRNIKRLMAYSSIGHMGFALVGLAAGTAEGVQGVLIYMAIYLAMTLGTFACILAMRRDGRHGRGHRRSRRALRAPTRRWRSSSALLMFSLAGIPPLAGFFAKYLRVPRRDQGRPVRARRDRRARQRGRRLLLSAIVKIMYFDEPAQRLRADAVRAQGGACRHRPVQSVVLRLSGAAARAASAAAKSLF